MNSVNLADLFVAVSHRWGDHTAIVSPHLTLSFRELIVRAARSARELRARGVAPGSNVGIAIRDSGEAIVLMLSLWMLGAVAVPIDFRAKPYESALLAREFDLIAIIEDRPKPGASGYASILVDEAWGEIIGRHSGEPLWGNYGTMPALISLTSATSGRPLGAVIDHERLAFRLMQNQLESPGGRALNAIPMSSLGARNHTLSQLFNGATVFFHPPLFGAGELTEAILSKRATTVCVVPTILHGLLEIHDDRTTPIFVDIDSLYCFGAPLVPEAKRRAGSVLSQNFVELYASSLSGRISLLHGADLQARPETVGRVPSYVALQIVDNDDEPLPVGQAGFIRIRSPAMARTTYRNMTRPSGDCIKHGWVYPGDIGVLDGDGFLCLVGRASDVIVRGGVNVHPLEVEAALADHEGVREVAVVGFPQSREGEEIAAFVVASSDLTESALVAHCRARLGPDKRPRKFIFVKHLPRNANGKVERIELRKRLESTSQEPAV